MADPHRPPLRLAVLLSGSGRTLQNLHDCIRAGTLPARIVFVLSSKPGVQGIERARAMEVPVAVLDRRAFPDPAAFARAVWPKIEPFAPDLVVLAGFVHLLAIPPEYKDRVLNIHPALLPAFGGKGYYGERVHAAVLRSGAKESGCTVHLVDDQYDHGPVILQRSVPVRPGDTAETLAARVFEEECRAYPEAIRRIWEGKAGG